MLCVCTGMSDGTSECLTVSLCHTPTQVPLPAREGREEKNKMSPRVRKQQVSASPLFAPRNHFIFLTRNNTQSNGFLPPSLPPSFPNSRAGKGKGSIEEPPPNPPWVPEPEWDHPVLRMCFVYCVCVPHARAHVRACLCLCHVCILRSSRNNQGLGGSTTPLSPCLRGLQFPHQ